MGGRYESLAGPGKVGKINKAESSLSGHKNSLGRPRKGGWKTAKGVAV